MANDYRNVRAGMAWIMETLAASPYLGGWAIKEVTADAATHAVYVVLTDRYGRRYRYRLEVHPEDDAE